MDKHARAVLFALLAEGPKAPSRVGLASLFAAKGRFRGRAALFSSAEACAPAMAELLGHAALESGSVLGSLAWERKRLAEHAALYIGRVLAVAELAERLSVPLDADMWEAKPLGRHRHEWRRLVREALSRAEGSMDDPLAARAPGHILRLMAERRVRAAYYKADFRVATHGHDVVFRLADEPGAASAVGMEWPNKVGLARSYKYQVRQSVHTIDYTLDILSAPPSEPGRMRLSATCEVRQGRGTTLAVGYRGGRR